MGFHLIGDRNRFAFDIGPTLYQWPELGLRRVDIWAAGIHLTCDDNQAYLSTFCPDLDWTIARLLSDRNLDLPFPDLVPEETHKKLYRDVDAREDYWFMQWGSTTEIFSSMVFRSGCKMFITFEFHREDHPRPDELGKVFVAEVPERELLSLLHQAACVLRYGR